MTFIHELADWPDLTWDREALAEPLSHARYRQGHLLGRMAGVGFPLRGQAFVEALTAETVTSWAIEGDALEAEQVRSSVARRLGIDVGGVKPPERHVEGIVDVMLDATQDHAAPLTEKRLFAWHQALFPRGWSGMHEITVGAWRPARADPMQVVSGPLGREKVHFEAPLAPRLDREIAQFLAWFNQPPRIDAVLRAGVAHFWFVTLHPFEDGNGRIARAVGELALAQAEALGERFYSMSSQILADRDAYYDVLERSQKGSLDITLWLRWFIDCFARAVDGAETILASVLNRDRFWRHANRYPLSERQRKVLQRLLEGFEGKLTTSKYAKLAKCSQDTALRDIHTLVEWRLLVQNPAGGRSTSYRLMESNS